MKLKVKIPIKGVLNPIKAKFNNIIQGLISLLELIKIDQPVVSELSKLYQSLGSIDFFAAVYHKPRDNDQRG